MELPSNARRRLGSGFYSAALLLAVFALASPVRGQSVTSAVIQGRVTDQSSGVLPGVDVSLTGPALQVPALTTVTAADGSYFFRDLPAGVYQIEYKLSGFQTVRREAFRLTVGFVARVDISMSIGGIEETLTVTGESPVVDTKSTASTTNFTNEILQTVPRGSAIWDVLAMAPGVTSTAAVDVGDSGMSHRSDLTNYGGTGLPKLAIEGINVQTGSDKSGAYYMDYTNYDEVQVKSAGNDAEMATSGLNFLATIKSGGNDYHGNYRANYQGPSLQGNNIDSSLTSQGVQNKAPLQHYYDLAGDLGGRIVRNKLWFYGSVTRQDLATQLLGFEKSPGPDGVYLTSDDVPGVTTTRLDNQTLKLSYQPTARYRVIGVYQRGVKALPDGAQDGSRFRPLEATTNYYFDSKVWKGELQGTPTDKLLFNVVGGFYGYVADYTAQGFADVPGNPSRQNLDTTVFTGPTSQASKRPNWRSQSEGSVSYFASPSRFGKHDLKAGYSLAFEGTGTGYLEKASGDYQLQFESIGGVPNQPFQIITYSYPVDPTNLMRSAGLYVKDSWTVSSRLTANVGMRWDRYHAFVPNQSKAAGAFSAAGTFPGVEVLTWKRVVPRAAIAWDVFGNGRTVVKATYGIFNTPLTNGFAGSQNKASLVSTTYRWRDLNGNGDYDPGEVNLNNNGPDFVSITSAANNINNPNLDQPYSQEATASLERELVKNVAVRATYVYQRESDLYRSANVLTPYSAYNIPIVRTDPGPDGKVGNADDGGPVTIYDYDAAYRGSKFVGNENLNGGNVNYYNSIDAGLTKRSSNRWSLSGTMGGTKNHVWSQPFFVTPNEVPFALNETWSWHGNFNGSIRLPYDVQFSALWTVTSGIPGARSYVFKATDTSGPALKQLTSVTQLLEPLGSQRTPTVSSVNLRGLKEFKMGTTKIGVEFDVYNLLNANAPTPTSTGAAGVTYASGPTYGYVTSILPARIARFGVKFSF